MNLRQATAVANPACATGVDFRHDHRLRLDAAEATESLDLFTIAGLSDVTVARLTRDELVRVICAADLPLPAGYDAERLRLQDRTTLRRLAYRARLACCNRVTILGRRCDIGET